MTLRETADETKTCKRCEEASDPTQFAFKSRATGKRDPVCKPCRREEWRVTVTVPKAARRGAPPTL